MRAQLLNLRESEERVTVSKLVGAGGTDAVEYQREVAGAVRSGVHDCRLLASQCHVQVHQVLLGVIVLGELVLVQLHIT